MNAEAVNPLIIIPVYNGRDSLLALIKRIPKRYDLPLMIVDDGSNDGLVEDDLAGALYLKHDSNKGKGAALKTGFDSAKGRGYSHAITLDADGQHDPDQINNFYTSMLKHPDAIINGKRDILNASMPFHRKLSNNITSLIISLRSGYLVRDSQVGYRCYPLRDSRLWDIDEQGFQFESAVYFNASKLRLKLIWQSIPVIYGNESSHMNLVKDTLRFIRTIFRSFL